MYKSLHPQAQGFNYCVQRDSAEAFLLSADMLKLNSNFCSKTLLSVTCKECNYTVEVADDGILNLPIKNTLKIALQALN